MLRMCWTLVLVLVMVGVVVVEVKVEGAVVHNDGGVSEVFWQAMGAVTVNQLVKTSPKSGLNGSCFSAANDYSNLKNCLRSQCVSADDVSKLYGVTSDGQLGPRNLSMTSAGLLYVMTQKSSCSSEIPEPHEPPTAAAVWGYGFLFVTLINICSLLGACVLPCLHSKVYKVLLLFMVALAVGTLVGSGLLVLIPEALELTEEKHQTFLWKMTTVMGGVFLFFLLERVMRYINNRRENTEEKRARDQEAMAGTYTSFFQRQPPEANPIPLPQDRKSREGGDPGHSGSGNRRRSSSRRRSSNTNNDSNSNSNSNTAFSNCAYTGEDSGDGLHGQSEAGCSDQPSQSSANLVAFDECAVNDNGLKNGNTANTTTTTTNSKKTSSAHGTGSMEIGGGGGARQIAPVAYMIIFGDALHNLIDGLSIGAAFTESSLLGISLSVAVMCEELPHELGDFAILLNSGMSMRKALLYNFLSSLSCYAGLVIGIQLGENTSANTWIFAIAGGMFLYISLADMLPEMNSAAESEDGKELGEVKTLCVQTFGLVVGFGIILLLAVFGEHINFE